MNTDEFERRLQTAMERVRTVLHVERQPVMASRAQHTYSDKYLLAEALTNTAIASQANAFSAGLGVTPEAWRTMHGWVQGGSAVSLRFTYSERSDFDRMEKRDVEAPSKHVTQASIGGTVRAALTSKVVTTVEDYFWKCRFEWRLVAVRGTGAEESGLLPIRSRSGVVELKSASKSPPRGKVAPSVSEANITWLLQMLTPDTLIPKFSINRERPSCHTPRRNADVSAAAKHFSAVEDLGAQIANCLNTCFKIRSDAAQGSPQDLASKISQSLFVPVLPLLDTTQGTVPHGAAPGAAGIHAGTALAQMSDEPFPEGSLVLAQADTNALLTEEARSLNAKLDSLAVDVPTSAEIAGSPVEAATIATLLHCAAVKKQLQEGWDYIEDMLRSQLIAAIGKEVSPADFGEYMRFHFSKTFLEAYAPKPFCHAVRRSDDHTPEGTLSIEQEVVGPGGDSTIPSPIVTLGAQAAQAHTMNFALGASTKIRFRGERHLHGWLSHQFSGQAGSQLQLVARARQFSSMIVLVGRISSATTFDPKYAAIVQNKDELTIPLDLSTIPTAKEFKDAIESLSPEQRAFAQAFRSMQLESTLFGILVIQIKPQLERVLNLADNALTKEIKLTQDLMQLFIKHQISSDLLSFDQDNEDGASAAGDASAGARLDAVKRHSQAMMAMVDAAKKEELKSKQMEAEFARARQAAEEAAAVAARREQLELEGRVRRSMVEDMLCAQRVLDSVQERSEDLMACSSSFDSREKSRKFGGGGGGMFSSLANMNMNFFSSSPVGAVNSVHSADVLPGPMAMSPMAVPGAVSLSAVPQSSPSQLPQSASQSSAQPATAPAQQPSSAAHQEADEAAEEDVEVVDYTQVPKQLDARFEAYDPDAALRPTIISPGEVWKKRSQKSLLAKPIEESVAEDAQKRAKDEAFDLLDALTKSGALVVDHAALHVIVAATHCFDKTVTETVIQDNANPIEKVERSSLIMASTVHGRPPAALLRPAQLPRISAACPALFGAEGEAAIQRL